MSGSRFTRPDETQVTVGVLSGAHVVNHMYLVVLPPLFGVLAEAFDVGLAALGAAMGVLGLVGTVMQLPYGYLADNYDRLVGVAANGLFGAVGAGVIALAPSFPWLVAGAAVMGVGVAGHHPVHYPMIVQSTSEERRGRAFSVYEFAGLIGFAVTPALVAGILSGGLTWRHAVGAVGFLGLAYGAVGLGLLWTAGDTDARRPVEATDERGGAADDLGGTRLDRVRAGVRALRDSPSILAMASFAFLIAIANWGVVSYVVVLLTDGYGVSLGAANVALTGVFAFSGIWVLYGGVIIDKVARGPDTVIAGSFGLAAPLVAVVATLAVPPPVAIAVVLLIGAAQGPSVPAISSVTDAFSAEENLGRNMAIITVGTYAGNGVAPPLIGWLIDAADLRSAFMFIAVVGLVAAFLMVGITRRYGDRAELRSSSAAD